MSVTPKQDLELKVLNSSKDDLSYVPQFYELIRGRSKQLVSGLTSEDMMLQSMEDASPAKWHLAHTTWFFEEFILKVKDAKYVSPDDRFAFLFNSYYVHAGPRHARSQRGLISTPNVDAVMAYRDHVDVAIGNLCLQSRDDIDDILKLIELGCHHEMQHQELLVTDLLHGLSHNPLLPAFSAPEPMYVVGETPLSWIVNEGGLVEIGDEGKGFSYDCEMPRHKTYLNPFKIASRPVTNSEWILFMEAGGYEDAKHWLSDGWATCEKEKWDCPLYWWKQDGVWWTFTLRGPQEVNLNAPVVHVSYYEADAYARFVGKRLPREAEWELVAREHAIDGNFLDDKVYRPLPASDAGNADKSTESADIDDGAGNKIIGHQFWGDVWEWTQSPFTPYPGFKPPHGAIGEYNGKFMSNQYVLRGGSCATPKAQMRATYRTFFYPHQRWQMLGLRLASDI